MNQPSTNRQAINRQILLRKRPQGLPKADDFELVETQVEQPGPGQLLARNLYLSLDPAIRGWMDPDETYLPPIPLNEPMWGTTIARVEQSNVDGYEAGDLVLGLNQWVDYQIFSVDQVSKLDNIADLPAYLFLSVLGATGLTAYFGLLDIGQPKPGETVLISGAAGAVGSIVGQIAKIKGCRVVGLAGSDEKCQWLLDDLGFDAVINYKTLNNDEATIAAAIKKACPDGVDVYFDNVGGKILDAVLLCVNQFARIAFCGAISSYNSVQEVPGPNNYWQVLVKSVRIEGFVVKSYVPRFGEGIAQLSQWYQQGLLQHKEHIVPGLELAPKAFLSLFDGSNNGKLIIKIAEP